MPHTCRICKTPFPTYLNLKEHWKIHHMREYVAVQTWLMDVDEAIVVADCVVKRQEKDIDLGDESSPVTRKFWLPIDSWKERFDK